ncbi:3-dehydroquinate synthase [Alkalibacillus silvisoli]|uniref:3-dehydroquinate synthase n=1 Tax=Alkalibacillus silvisoli TaxID=392823 RepID=A0ABP3JMX6_9BACI
MKEITVKSSIDYKINIGTRIRFNIYEFIKEFNYNKIAVITDENVAKYYLEDVVNGLTPFIQVVTYNLPSGEKIKDISWFERLQQFLLNEQLDRHSAVIALGGGVVGDLSGFVASTYMRGIGFVQVPTTLLAHDSSIGGKVAINLGSIKNIIGHFYPPQAVIYDLDTLSTLSEQEFRSGLAEVIKHSLIGDAHLYEQLITKQELSVKDQSFEKILHRSIDVKRVIVEADELELGKRKFLNFGHTLGHAIESVYQSKNITHGEAVMVGILFDLFVSDLENGERQGMLSGGLITWLTNIGYKLALSEWRVNQLLQLMLKDKKNEKQLIALVLLRDYEQPYVKHFSPKEVKNLLEAFAKYMGQYSNVKYLV